MTERELLAAEHALRLLEGEELMEARRLASADPAFAAEVAAWEERLAPLFAEIAEEAPGADLWPRILRRLDEQQDGGNVVRLRRQLARWRAGAAVAAVAAAVLLMVQLQPASPPPAPGPAPAIPAPLLVASLAGSETDDALTVAYRPATRELVIDPARLALPPGRARELWLIPDGAQPISLGLVAPQGVQRRTLEGTLAARFAAGATIAVSDEPTGGSPTGQPTGAVLAAGNLTQV